MFAEKIKALAHTIVNYSLEIKKGEKFLIEVRGEGTDEILSALIEETLKVGGVPYWNRNQDEATSSFIANANIDQMKSWTSLHKMIMENVDAYVAIRGADNTFELSNVSSDNMSNYMKTYQKEVHSDLRVPKKKWVVLRWPNHSMAQLAEMNTKEFAKFFFDTCSLDYKSLGEKMDKLVDVMNRTDKVRIVSCGTDVSFSIKNIPAIKCAGKLNIPDGEVYTAPVRDSVNGVITYNAPSFYNGKLFSDVKFEIKNGKIIKATSSLGEEIINKILDVDEGARYFGEFAIGVNPYVNKVLKDTLFDEKIYGSIHLTPGSSYDNAFNGNKSSLHWDLVLIQTKEFGGGEIYFDDKLIRKDGEFVIDELKCLNK